jgi:low affinity Fe/Cu permease
MRATTATAPIAIPAMAPPLRELLLGVAFAFGEVVTMPIDAAVVLGMAAVLVDGMDEDMVVDIIDIDEVLDEVINMDIDEDIDIEDAEEIDAPESSTELFAIMLRPISLPIYSL